MPRETISVATSTSTLPFRKSSITSSRSFCSRSECIARAFIWFARSARVRSFTRCFFPTKMITFVNLSPFASGVPEKSVDFWGALSPNSLVRNAVFCVSKISTAIWRMLSGGREMAICTSTGLCMMALAILRIFAGMVAENRIVCRSLGSLLTIVIMSS